MAEFGGYGRGGVVWECFRSPLWRRASRFTLEDIALPRPNHVRPETDGDLVTYSVTDVNFFSAFNRVLFCFVCRNSRPLIRNSTRITPRRRLQVKAAITARYRNSRMASLIFTQCLYFWVVVWNSRADLTGPYVFRYLLSPPYQSVSRDSEGIIYRPPICAE